MENSAKGYVRGRGAVALACALVLGLAGCGTAPSDSLIDPVPPVPPPPVLAGQDAIKDLAATVDWATQYQNLLFDMARVQDKSHAYMNAGAFVLGAAAAVSGLYEAGHKVILGLGLGSAGLLATDAVTYQRGYVKTYSDGAETVGCIIGVGNDARATADEARIQGDQLDQAVAQLEADVRVSPDKKKSPTKRSAYGR